MSPPSALTPWRNLCLARKSPFSAAAAFIFVNEAKKGKDGGN